MEQFKKIKGYDNYSISSYGRVYNNKFKRFLKSHKDKDGYLCLILCNNKKQKRVKIHRLMGIAFIPNPENKPQINHKNGIKNDNEISNLEWCTVGENNQHAYDIGLKKGRRGEKSSSSKLTENQVLEIRRLYSSGEYTQTALAKMFDVSQKNIGNIVNRKIWKHI